MQGKKKHNKNKTREIAKETSTLLNPYKKAKDNSLLSSPCATDLGLGQISEALVHNERRWGGTAPLIFWFASLFPAQQSKQN